MNAKRGLLELLFLTVVVAGAMQLALAEESVSGRRVDGKAIDQGIAYVLMLVALFVTYILH
ncbi:hypothetical protein Cni_G05738 [Canna indica]|uniref:Uncharacterized protein n=1 Tax=Canna indica TaxID=4628 RepID=A0AAQ3Q5B3_9LILI|nr:hypothetical protein Cni_G05738 [Canna indica]